MDKTIDVAVKVVMIVMYYSVLLAIGTLFCFNGLDKRKLKRSYNNVKRRAKF